MWVRLVQETPLPMFIDRADGVDVEVPDDVWNRYAAVAAEWDAVQQELAAVVSQVYP